ncbi:uncharacterized protein LOC120350005 isoform X2 [Nilaparvata lugens]|uniref:uncharacterized protein LOC120350005 isoform X2 n=1 Tax=Nilaparvata lugens TaxID=108931 RepID=UPI00193DB218|nr:uncharacterized protein LOC120350005 isoform X2 [Nilaparvata lugens]
MYHITSKIMSPRYVLLLIFTILAIGVTIYFVNVYYFHGEQDTEPEQENLSNATEAIIEGETGEKPEVDFMPGQIEGSLYLKSIFKNMVCERKTDDENTLYVSCCGIFQLPNVNDEHKGCLSLEAQKVFDSIDYLFRIKLNVDDKLIGSRQSIGVAPPSNSCFDVGGGSKLCADFTLVVLDNGEANESAFNTCALMIISSKFRRSWETAPDVQDLEIKTEYLPCDTEKSQLLEKSTNKFATVMRIYLSTIEEEPSTKVHTKEGVQASLFLKSVTEDMVCDIKQDSTYSVSCCGNIKIPGSEKKPKGCIILEAKKLSEKNDADITFGMKIKVDDDTIGYTDTKGLLLPGTKCFDIGAFPGFEMCVDLSILSMNSGFVDESIFKSCALLTVSSKSHTQWEGIPPLSDVIGKSSAISCDSTENDIIKTTGSFVMAIARVFVNSSASESNKPKKQVAATIATVDSQNQHPPYGGAIYLKTDFEGMTCELTYLGSANDQYALTCSGKVTLDDNQKHTGALLVKSMRRLIQGGENEYLYNVSLTVDNAEVISLNFTEFPAPARQCFPLHGFPDLKECIDLDDLLTDENLSNENHFKSCKMMVFNSHKEVSQYGSYHLSAAIRRLEVLSCSTSKEVLLKKGGEGADVLRISFEKATDDDKREWGTLKDTAPTKKQVQEASSSGGILGLINSGLKSIFY